MWDTDNDTAAEVSSIEQNNCLKRQSVNWLEQFPTYMKLGED